MKKIFTLLFLFSLTLTNAQTNNVYKYTTNDVRKNIGGGLIVGGIAFTAAAFIEGGSQYGHFVSVAPTNLNGYSTTQFITPPIYKQTPRNIMFCVGFGLTITGLITVLSKN